jgi:RNA polymerase sigma-32 factor
MTSSTQVSLPSDHRGERGRKRLSKSAATSADALSVYLSQILKYPLLSLDDEQRLARAHRRSADSTAAHALINANLRFVVKVAFEYRSFGLNMPDLIQEGNLGLMKAIDKFDPDKGIRLVSYAVWWIRAYIREFILRSWSLVKLGTTRAQRTLFFGLSRTKRELERSDGRRGESPSTERIAEAMGVRPTEVLEMEQRLEGRDLSLDAPVGDGGSSHIDFVTSNDQSPDEALSDKQGQRLARERVARALGSLDRRERLLIEARTMSDKAVTLRVLGNRLGLSSERARQLETQAKHKMKGLLLRQQMAA